MYSYSNFRAPTANYDLPTALSHQLMDGVHVKIVSERAGHASVGITLSAYAAFIPNMQADAAAGVDRWLRQALAEVGGKSVAVGEFATNEPNVTR